VDSYFHNLGFEKVFGPLKSRGVDINSLVRLLVTYKLVENHSIARAGDWANQAFIHGRYGLPRIDQQTLYRTLERLGMHADEVMAGIQDAIFSTYDFPKTDVNLDWTSIVLHGNAAELGKRGYSRDHRPDKRQLTLGLSELASPVNVPVGLTVREGNVNDQAHFADTYGLTFVKPRSTDYFYFSKTLHETQERGARERAQRMLDEAVELQRDLDAGKRIKKKYRGGPSGNCLIDARTTFQTKLVEMSEEEAYDYALSRARNGREGFFCLKPDFNTCS
jgi:hypothetical protein